MKRKRKSRKMMGPVVDDGWRARSDMRTLMDAEEIRRDSGRHRAAKGEAKKEAEKAARVARLEKEPL